ncbi:hypothetical protein [Halobacillus sp. B29]|uniref:hypothetical protein n=1 Tax=Halobacillus sp. B29 TaxID=3457432 RepID=UPI003FCD8BF6
MNLKTNHFIKGQEIEIGDILEGETMYPQYVTINDDGKLVTECIRREGKDGDGIFEREQITRMDIWHDLDVILSSLTLIPAKSRKVHME